MQLIPADQNRLEELETVIHKNFLAFYEVGRALKEIRTCKLYRGTHETFELYCRELWDVQKRHANKLIAASKVIDILSAENGANWPQNEAQTRPLTRLETPEQQIEAWKRAVQTAPNGRITAKHVNDVVREAQGDAALRRSQSMKDAVNSSPAVPQAFKDCYFSLLDIIRDARETNFKGADKEKMLQYLDGLRRFIED